MPKSQLELFQDELQKLPEDAPTRGAWQGLIYVLTDFLTRMEDVEGMAKVMQSDVRETKNMVSRMCGGEIQFDEYNHPMRRKTDDKKDATPERTWFIRYVLPGLVQATILFVAGILLTLVAINILKLFPQVI